MLISFFVAFHDGLDFVSVHETVTEDLKKVLASVRQRQSLEMQVETVAQKKATNLGNRRAFYNVSTLTGVIYWDIINTSHRRSSTLFACYYKGRHFPLRTWQTSSP